jgi:hypothetical protein
VEEEEEVVVVRVGIQGEEDEGASKSPSPQSIQDVMGTFEFMDGLSIHIHDSPRILMGLGGGVVYQLGCRIAAKLSTLVW